MINYILPNVSVSNFLKFETLWSSLSASTPHVELADLTASTASDAVPHRRLLRNDIFLVAAATSTIAQLRSKITSGFIYNKKTTLEEKRYKGIMNCCADK